MKKKERILELDNKVKTLEKELNDKEGVINWYKQITSREHKDNSEGYDSVNYIMSLTGDDSYLFCETTQKISNNPISVKLNKDIVFCNLGYLKSDVVTRIKRYLDIKRLTIDELKHKLEKDPNFEYSTIFDETCKGKKNKSKLTLAQKIREISIDMLNDYTEIESIHINPIKYESNISKIKKVVGINIEFNE